MADPERFDADPVPTFQVDPDPKNFLPNLHFFFSIILHNLSCVIFSLTKREEGWGVRDKV